MGYTYYLEGKMDNTQFPLFVECVKAVISKEEAEGVEFANGHGKRGTKPKVTNKVVCYNGVDDDSHETCYIEAKGLNDEVTPGGFKFCKTARKPYDEAVVVTFALASILLGVKMSSDGGDEEVKRAKKIARTIIEKVLMIDVCQHGNDDGGVFYTTNKYWDCDCKENYIHHKSEKKCKKCCVSSEDGRPMVE